MGLKFTQKLINCSDFNHYSERLIKQQADRLAEDGYKDAGYEYVSIDVSVAIFYYCCAATEGSEQQHNQDLKEIYKGATNSRIHHFLPQCIAFNQSALRHKQLK